VLTIDGLGLLGDALVEWLARRRELGFMRAQEALDAPHIDAMMTTWQPCTRAPYASRSALHPAMRLRERWDVPRRDGSRRSMTTVLGAAAVTWAVLVALFRGPRT
jgi:hypothetical protein